MALHARSRALLHPLAGVGLISGVRQAEAPFRQSLTDAQSGGMSRCAATIAVSVRQEKSYAISDYCLASGMFSTARQAGGSCAMVIGGFGFGGSFGGFGCSVESLNQ